LTGSNAFTTGTTGPAGVQVGVGTIVNYNDTFFKSSGTGVVISDIGSTSNSGGSITTTTADGVFDVGGTAGTGSSNYVVNNVNAGFETGGGTHGGLANPAGGWEWKVGQFTFLTGTFNSSGSSTFLPLVPTGSAPSSFTTTATTTSTNVTSAFTPDAAGGGVTWNVQGGGGNDSVLNMQPATVPLNVLAGGTLTTNLTVTNTAADAATSTGQFTTNLSAANIGTASLGTITNNPVGATPSTVPVNYAAPAAPTTTQATFSLAITNTSNAADAQGGSSNKTTAFTVNVGDSVADNTGKQPTDATAFNGSPAMTASVQHGVAGATSASTSYAGLESQVTSLSGTGGFDAQFPTGNAHLGGTAIIRAGTNTLANGGGAATVAMQWRTLSTSGAINEQTGAGPGNKGRMYATNLFAPTTGLISDVVNLTGLTPGAESAGGTTDPFDLQMSYNPARLPKAGAVEGGLAANKLITMVSFSNSPTNSGGDGLWDRAVDGNTGNVITSMTDPHYGFIGSWDTFATTAGGGNFGTVTPTNTQLTSQMGAWGVDTTNHVVWAILDHNSQFAVVPEPSTILLAGLGLMGLVGLRRRMKASA